MKYNGIELGSICMYAIASGRGQLMYTDHAHRWDIAIKEPLPEGCPRVTEIPSDANLYFDSSSTIPRIKLMNTDFKRRVKVSKADYIVGDFNCRTLFPKHLYIVQIGNCYGYIADLVYFNNIDEVKRKCESMGATFRVIDEGDFYLVKSMDSWRLKYMRGEYTIPYISDADFNKVLNRSLEKLTYEKIDIIMRMIYSSDKATRSIGVTTLHNYDIGQFPVTLGYLLKRDTSWKDGSVLAKDLDRQTQRCWWCLDEDGICITNNTTEEDKEMCKRFIIHYDYRD